jgi:hypothetical protein
MAEKNITERAGELQKVYLQNLAFKLREGESLSEREFEHLRLLSKNIGSTSPTPDSLHRSQRPDQGTNPISTILHKGKKRACGSYEPQALWLSFRNRGLSLCF